MLGLCSRRKRAINFLLWASFISHGLLYTRIMRLPSPLQSLSPGTSGIDPLQTLCCPNLPFPLL